MADVNLTIKTGVTFRQSFIWQDSSGARISLSGMSARMQIRPKPRGVVLVDASTSNGKIALQNETINGSSVGVITITLTGADTASIVQTEAVYDVKVSASGGEPSYRVVEGTVTFDLGVTE